MPRQTLSAVGIVLSRGITAGGYERLNVLSAEHGLLGVMHRQSSSTKVGPAPDLFDHCQLELDSRSGGAWFLREYTLDRRYSGLGVHYEALEAASVWAKLLLANAPSMDGTESLFALSLKALDAWERGENASAVLIKTLFVFARDEGLPVSQEWLAGLPADLRETVSNVLRKPLGGADADAVDAAALSSVPTGMIEWMCGNHHIIHPR